MYVILVIFFWYQDVTEPILDSSQNISVVSIKTDLKIRKKIIGICANDNKNFMKTGVVV
jgi:hypothetical protein